jgi:hypothetical protein
MTSPVSHDPFRGRRVRAVGRFAGPGAPAPAPAAPPPAAKPEPPAPTEAPVDEDARRAALVAEAEKLGIRVRSNMKTETIERKIAEARAEDGGA